MPGIHAEPVPKGACRRSFSCILDVEFPKAQICNGFIFPRVGIPGQRARTAPRHDTLRNVTPVTPPRIGRYVNCNAAVVRAGFPADSTMLKRRKSLRQRGM